VPISQPIPPEEDVLVEMGVFGFSTRGLIHNINDVEAEVVFLPTYAPEGTDG